MNTEIVAMALDKVIVPAYSDHILMSQVLRTFYIQPDSVHYLMHPGTKRVFSLDAKLSS